MLTTPNTDNAEHTTGLQRGIALKPWHANLHTPTINLLAQESRTLAHNAPVHNALRRACRFCLSKRHASRVVNAQIPRWQGLTRTLEIPRKRHKKGAKALEGLLEGRF